MRGIAKGMVTTLRHLFTPAFTIQYPDVKRQLPERSRQSFAMRFDASGQPLCKSCLLCEKSCPDDAIHIESEKREDGPGRRLTRFTIDLGRCMYCGMCIESCSSGALMPTGDFESSTTERSGTILLLHPAQELTPVSAPPLAPDPAPATVTTAEEGEGA